MSLLEIHIKNGSKCMTKSDLFSLMIFLTGLFGFLISILGSMDKTSRFLMFLVAYAFITIPIFVKEK